MYKFISVWSSPKISLLTRPWIFSFAAECQAMTVKFTDVKNNRTICYFGLPTAQGFDESNATCSQNVSGAQLAIIPSKDAKDFIKTSFSDFLKKAEWVIIFFPQNWCLWWHIYSVYCIIILLQVDIFYDEPTCRIIE